MRYLARILALAVLIAAPFAARADDHPTTAPPEAEAPPQPQPTPLSELDVVAKPKPKPTPLSELDVVVARKLPTNVSGVEVKAPQSCLPPRSPADPDVPAPKLVSTYPSDGQAVQPGYTVLRLTFDLPMACRGSLPQNLLAACFADGVEIWHESFDRKSLMIVCDLKANAHYQLGINRRIPEHFQGLSGNEPEASDFSFDTTSEPPIRTAADMLRRDAQMVAMLTAAASHPADTATGSDPKIAAKGEPANVSIVKVQETNRCLQPRDPPDNDVPAPKLVSTFPAQGQTVRPGLLEVRFTFDLPMACVGGVAVKPGAPDPCGHLQIKKAADGGTDSWKSEDWSQTWDRHTMVFRCRVEPGKRYVVFINTNVGNKNSPGGGVWSDFKGLGGRPAAPYELTFTASNDAPVQTQEEADVEDPFMAARLDGREPEREQ
jgi:hypothetical protein